MAVRCRGCRRGCFALPFDCEEVANFANRAEWKMRLHDEGLCGGWRQKFAAALDHLLAIAVGEESKMSDLDEAAGEHMKEEATDKLDGLQ